MPHSATYRMIRIVFRTICIFHLYLQLIIIDEAFSPESHLAELLPNHALSKPTGVGWSVSLSHPREQATGFLYPIRLLTV
jgi:hypothetical protein